MDYIIRYRYNSNFYQLKSSIVKEIKKFDVA